MFSQNPVFIPGPTNMPERLRRAVDIPTIDHRSAEFGRILHPALEGVKTVLKAPDAQVFIFPSTGTGGWETAITNTLSAGDKVLAARNGMFSHRWIDMCQRHNLDVTVVQTPWGEGIPTDRFEEILTADKDHQIRVVLATHNETATGVKSDIAGIRRAMDRAGHPALLFVDGVSSIGSMDFRMQEWGVDIAVTGSQKGFMLPPGLAITAFSAKAMAAVETARLPRTFFDIRDMASGYARDGYPYTPPVGLINGLNESCQMLLAEGIENVFARHHRIASGVRAAIDAWGMTLCATRPEFHSDSVSAIVVPEGFDANQIVSHALDQYQVAFGTGLGDVAGKVWRIGHLGSLTDGMALLALSVAEMVMVDLGLPVQLGAGVAAAQDSYRHSAAALQRKAA